MIGYVMVGTNNLDKAITFYDEVLKILDLERKDTDEFCAGYAQKDGDGTINILDVAAVGVIVILLWVYSVSDVEDNVKSVVLLPPSRVSTFPIFPACPAANVAYVVAVNVAICFIYFIVIFLSMLPSLYI